MGAAPDFRLDGKVAIVTGASSGIGRRFAQVLADQGATVLAAARRVDRLDDLAGTSERIHAAGCDVADDAQLEQLVERAVGDLGRIDVIVNNAGTTDAVTPAEHEDPAEFRRVVDVNMNACFVLSAAAARQMIVQEQGGSIVNISSVHGLVAAAPNAQAAYAASKGGLVNLTRELAAQWAKHRIRVNTIAPGYFETELTAAMFVGEDAGLRYIRRGTLLGRPGELHELDGALLLLATDAGSYITGQTIAVDGGWTAR
ncbi:MAG TPA: SDR family oxidoreductase [Acidimicrobiales bacterium]|nr:SDR family oxidoreductase [Acidimicrobiales bacterium]